MKINTFDRNKVFAITASTIIILFFSLMPLPQGLGREGMVLTGFFLSILILWIFVSIDWPSLLALAGLSLFSATTPSKIFSASFGNQTVAFLIFTFSLTYALSKTPFLKRLAIYFISSKFSQKGMGNFFVAYAISLFILGLFLSPTILFIMYLTFHEEICKCLNLKRGSRPAAALMLMQVFICAITSGMTPISHVFPILAFDVFAKFSGHQISYLHFMSWSIPVGIIITSGIVCGLIFWCKKEKNCISGGFIINKENFGILPPLSSEEKIILSVSAIVVIMWLLPGLPASFAGGVPHILKSLGNAFPPLVGVILLFLFSSKKHQLINFGDTVKNGIAWGSILMCSATLAFGSVLLAPEIGIKKFLADNFTGGLSSLSVIMAGIVIILWAGIQTNITSNIVTVSLVSLIVIPLATTGKISLPAELATYLIGFVSSCSFATPAAHPNVALAIGSGWITAKQILVAGGLSLLFTSIILAFPGYIWFSIL